MPTIRFQNHDYHVSSGETVLETLLRHGVEVNHSCRAGVCQSCLMRSTNGKPDIRSQKGLKDTQKERQYFLACVCSPEEDMVVEAPDEAENRHYRANVKGLTRLSDSVMQVRLQVDGNFEYRAGQFINLSMDRETTRSYSIASVPRESTLELHVRKMDGGRVSTWVHEQLRVGESVTISDAHGNCFYTQKDVTQPLLMIATGTGLAPILGIVKDALLQQHQGNIWLYHGSRNLDGLYFQHELQELAEHYSNFRYIPCLSGENREGYRLGRANDVALSDHSNLKSWRIYLCGNAEMVNDSKRMAFLGGASLSDIFSDPFIINPPEHLDSDRQFKINGAS